MRRFNLYERCVLAAVLVVVGASLALGHDGRSGGARETAAGTPPRALSDPDVRRIARRVERLRGLRFRRPVEPLFVSAQRGSEILKRQIESGYSSRKRRIDEEELKLLGLLRPSDDLGRVIRAIEQEQVLGFYDDRSKRLVVIRRRNDAPALLEITLAHELVHALESQRFGLHVRGGLSDDAAIGESALAEGTATAIMTEYAERYVGAAGLLGASLGAAARTETKLPPYVEESLLFPYVEGEKFVNAFRTPNGGWRAVDRILALRPPRSAEQVLHPQKYAIDEKPAKIAIPSLAQVLGKAWRRVDSTSVGEFDLRALLKLVGDSREGAAAAAAAGWGGGRFTLWRKEPSAGSCAAPCIALDAGVLELRWDRALDRTQADEELPHVFEHGLRARRIGARVGLGVWSSRGGGIGMVSRGRSTTIAFAPSAPLAAHILLRSGGR
jgi:hypothetical protein